MPYMICKKPLSDFESIMRGIGPVCWANQLAEQECDDTAYLPFTGDVVVSRNGNSKRVNIPRTLVKHSPDGFEWGYGGSGPADFALNILYFFTDNIRFSYAHYQDFKWQFVATIPKKGGTIKGDAIRQWIVKRDVDLFSNKNL